MTVPTVSPIGSPAPGATQLSNVASSSNANTEVMNNNMDVDSSLAEANVSHITHADVEADMKIAFTLLKSSIRDLSLYIASAPAGVELTNARTSLANKMKDLKMMKAVCSSMSDDTSSVASVSTSSVISPSRTETFVSRAPTAIVPKLCLFQWEGQVFNRAPGNQVFADIKACIQHFEDIMNSHCLDLDTNYLRLLPPLLSPTARILYDDFLHNYRTAHVASPTWIDFTTAFTARYGLNIHEERAKCARELTTIKMLDSESIENFIDRFNTLRRRAVDQVLPNSLLINTFGRALPHGLFEQITVAVAPLDDARKYDLDIITAFARDFFNKFYKNVGSVSSSGSASSSKRSHVQAALDNDVHSSSAKSKYAHAYTPVDRSSSVSPPASRSVTPRREIALNLALLLSTGAWFSASASVTTNAWLITIARLSVGSHLKKNSITTVWN